MQAMKRLKGIEGKRYRALLAELSEELKPRLDFGMKQLEYNYLINAMFIMATNHREELKQNIIDIAKAEKRKLDFKMQMREKINKEIDERNAKPKEYKPREMEDVDIPPQRFNKDGYAVVDNYGQEN